MGVKVKAIVPLLALDYEIEFDDEVKTIPAYGGDVLINETLSLIPESAKLALINAQNVNINLKIEMSRKWMAGVVATNFGVGFIPIPFSDSAIMVSAQITMLAKITSIFGIDMDKSMLKPIVMAIGGVGGAAIAGKTIVANLLKLIPGIGTIAGGVISGGTAALLTTALGEAYIKIMVKVAEGELNFAAENQEKVIEQMKDIFKTELHSAKKSDSEFVTQ